MRLDIVTIFPDYLRPLTLSLIGKAIDNGIVDLHVHDLRDFTHDRHRTVDDTPFGGGPGMVMKPEPWGEAIDAILAEVPATTDVDPRVDANQPVLLLPTPSGATFDQRRAQQLSSREWIVIACGRYEGIDARVAEHYRQRMQVVELSIGDYVLAGGEAAALVISEAMIRLLPGVLGNEQSAHDDSFAPNRAAAALEAPTFTKPALWRGLSVPPVLLSGHHGAVSQWREEQAADRTRRYRPELMEPPEAD